MVGSDLALRECYADTYLQRFRHNVSPVNQVELSL